MITASPRRVSSHHIAAPYSASLHRAPQLNALCSYPFTGATRLDASRLGAPLRFTARLNAMQRNAHLRVAAPRVPTPPRASQRNLSIFPLGASPLGALLRHSTLRNPTQGTD
jgi:hypothetical protein